MPIYTRLAGTGTWASTALWQGGTVPASGTTNEIHFAKGTHNITDGGVIAGAVDVNKLVIPGDARVNLNGAILELDVSNGTDPKLIIEAVGQAASINLKGTFDKAEIYGTGPVSLSGSAPDIFAWVGANLTINGDCTTSLIIAEKANISISAHGSDRVDTLRQLGGSVVSARSIEAGRVSQGGTLTITGAASLTDGSTGGTFELNDERSTLVIESEGLTITATGQLMAGTVDTSRVRTNTTWTTATRTPACRIMVGGGTGQVTITNDSMKGNMSLAELTP